MTGTRLSRWWTWTETSEEELLPKFAVNATPDEYDTMIACQTCHGEGTVTQELGGHEFPVPCKMCGGSREVPCHVSVSRERKVVAPHGFEVDKEPKSGRYKIIYK